jgi:hypothetical protein
VRSESENLERFYLNLDEKKPFLGRADKFILHGNVKNDLGPDFNPRGSLFSPKPLAIGQSNQFEKLSHSRGQFFCLRLLRIMPPPSTNRGEVRVVRVLPEWTSPEIPVYAVFPSQLYLAPKVRQFVDYLAAHLKLD